MENNTPLTPEGADINNRAATKSEIQEVFEKGMQTAATIMLDLFNLVQAKKFVQSFIEVGEDLYVIRLHKISPMELHADKLNEIIQNDDANPAVN